MNTHVRNLICLLLVLMGILGSNDLEAGMENCRFAMHWKPKFRVTTIITSLCDNPATTTIEPNYSPNWESSTSTPNPLPCRDYTVTAPMGQGTVYVVIGRAGLEGVAGASFGINYSGTNSVGIDPRYVTWTPCADGAQFPSNDGVHGDFPHPGGGIRICWNSTSCQAQIIPPDGVHAVIGSLYVYAYSPDQLQVTPNYNTQNRIPELVVTSCPAVTTDLVQVWGISVALQHCTTIGFAGLPGVPSCLIQDPPEVSSPSTTWGALKGMYRGSAQPLWVRKP